MKNLSRFCPEIFKSRLACAFLIAQLVFSAFIFDWNKLFLYFEENNEKRCHSVASEAAPSFGGYHTDDSIKADEILGGFFFLISFPAVITTALLTGILKAEHPQWCVETFNFIGTFAFVLLNSIYWMIIAHLIEIAHTNYLRKRSEPEKPFSIFSGSD